MKKVVMYIGVVVVLVGIIVGISCQLFGGIGEGGDGGILPPGTNYNYWVKRYDSYPQLEDTVSINRIGTDYYVLQGDLVGIITKIDKDGNLQWNKRYQVGGNEVPLSKLIEAGTNSYWVMGCDDIDNVYVLLNINGNGELLNSKQLPAGPINIMIDGGQYVIVGGRGNYPYPGIDCVILRWDGNSDTLSGKYYSSPGNYNEAFNRVIQEEGSSYYVLGFTDGFGGGTGDDILFAKVDKSTLGVQLAKKYSSPGNYIDTPTVFVKDGAGNFIIGWDYRTRTDPEGGLVVMKVDSNFDVVWAKKYTAYFSSMLAIGQTLLVLNDGSIVGVGGSLNPVGAGTGDIDAMMFRLSGVDGSVIEAYGFGGGYIDKLDVVDFDAVNNSFVSVGVVGLSTSVRYMIVAKFERMQDLNFNPLSGLSKYDITGAFGGSMVDLTVPGRMVVSGDLTVDMSANSGPVSYTLQDVGGTVIDIPATVVNLAP